MVAWVLHGRITKIGASLQRGLSSSSDNRIGRTQELLDILIPIKFFSWEDFLVQRISEARREEVKWLNKSVYL